MNREIYNKLKERKQLEDEENEFSKLCQKYQVCPECGNHLDYILIRYGTKYTCVECLHSFTVYR